MIAFLPWIMRELKIKEALYIKWLDSTLNKQKKNLKIALCLLVVICFFTINLFRFPSHLQVILSFINLLIMIVVLSIYI